MIYITHYPTEGELERMSAQDVFNHVARHLLAMGMRATDGEGHCRYRLHGTLSACAIGALMPERDYCTRMEGHTVIGLVRSFGDCSGGFWTMLRRHVGLCVMLQRIHDGAPVPLWPHMLRELARRAGFDTRVLGNAGTADGIVWHRDTLRQRFDKHVIEREGLYNPGTDAALDFLHERQIMRYAPTFLPVYGFKPDGIVIDEVAAALPVQTATVAELEPA